MAMTLVSTVTVGSGGAASIEFTGIAGTGKDLLVLLSIRTTNASVNDAVNISINGVTTNQSYRRLRGDGSAVASDSGTSLFARVNGNNATTSTFGNALVYFSNYATSNNKSVSMDVVNENNATAAQQELTAGLWSSSNAITSLSFSSPGQTIQQHSTASLYIIS